MPQVKERQEFEKYHCNAELSDPDECVAKGAAIYATTLGKRDDTPTI